MKQVEVRHEGVRHEEAKQAEPKPEKLEQDAE